MPDTVDVRTGPEVSEELLSVLPLLGEWHGEGGRRRRPGTTGSASGSGSATTAGASSPTSRAPGGSPTTARSSAPTSGSPVSGARAARTTSSCSSPARTAWSSSTSARARTTTSWELTTDVLARTPDAPDVTRAVRLYGIVDGALMYAIDRAGADEPLRPAMSARLERIR